MLVLPLVPDFSGESLPVISGTHPRRSGANGRVNWAISLRAPSYVCRRAPLFPRIGPLAGIVDRSALGAPPRGHTCKAGGAGGTRVTERAQRLWRLYGSGEMASHPVCLVRECLDRPALVVCAVIKRIKILVHIHIVKLTTSKFNFVIYVSQILIPKLQIDRRCLNIRMAGQLLQPSQINAISY